MKSHHLMQEVKAKLQELANDTDKVRKSAFFQHYLDTVAKFWHYSYHNQLLIYFTLPGASRVAGFKTWQGLGRNVKKGSKAIKILAPIIRLEQEEEKEQEVLANFIPVSVFDISQTEGEELPELDVTLEGDDQEKVLGRLEEFCTVKGIKLEYKQLGVNGWYGYSMGGKVVVSSQDSINMKVNTLVHEITHELLHRDSPLSTQEKEIQAEGTAYVVCRHFGLETKSFNYLALYDADAEKIMQNLKAVAEASKEVIEFVSLQPYL